jgi:tetratricopeptide (TPR) repeat protein
LTIRRVVACTAVILGLSLSSPVLAQQRDQDEESQLLVEEARRALSKKDYSRAGSLLDKALVTAPRRLDLYILRASVYGVNGKHDAAVSLLERARRLAPDNVRVLTALGIHLIQSGRPADGVPILERIVTTDQTRYDAQVVLGHHYVKRGSWPEAAKAFDAYFTYRPKALAREDGYHRLDHANARLRSGDAARALALYQEVLAGNNKDERARLGVAWATAAVSCKKAMPVLDGVADLEAKYSEVSLVRGRCALMLGRLDEAAARAERYRKAAPNAIAGSILLGDVRVAQGNYKEAEAAFRQAADKSANDPLIQLKLARVERLNSKFGAASERLKSAGAPRYYEDDWTIEYGETLLALKQPAPLRDLMQPWIKTHEGHGTGELLTGAALVQLGSHAEAVPHLERAAQKNEPRAARMLVDALNTLAVAAVQKKDTAEATKLLERAAEAGGSALTTRNLAALLIAQDSYERALAVLKKADPNDAASAHLLGRAYHGLKRYDDARPAYQRAAKLYGKDPRVVSALRDFANAELAAGKGEEALAAIDQAATATPASERKELDAVRINVARSAANDAMRAGRFAVAVRLLKAVEKAADGDALVQLRCDLALAATGAQMRDQALDVLRGLERSKARCGFAAPVDEIGLPILIAWNEDASPARAKKTLDRLEGLRRKATGVAEPLLRQAATDIALRAAAEAYAAGNYKASAAFLVTARGYDKRSVEATHNQAVIDIWTGSVDSAIGALAPLVNEVPEARVNLGIAYEKKGEPLKALSTWKSAASAGVRFAPLRDWIEAKERFWGAQ